MMNSVYVSHTQHDNDIGMTRRSPSRTISIIVAMSLLSVGCEDLLPEYTIPTELLKVSYLRVESDTIRYYGREEDYARTFENHYLRFSLSNIYEETLENTAAFDGKLEVWIDGMEALKSSTVVLESHLIPTPHYNTTTKLLTLDTGDEIYFKVPITMMMANGYYFQIFAPVTQQWTTARPNYYYYVHAPLRLNYRFSVISFPNKAPEVVEGNVSVVFFGRISYRL